MSADPIIYRAEAPADDAAIEEINREAFGPGRFARSAHRLREDGPHAGPLSFVAEHEGAVVASVRQTWIAAGGIRAVLLGPLAVGSLWKNRGIGRALVRMALEAARAAGSPMVILVGDESYYGPLGFAMLPCGQVSMPWPVNPERLLAAVFDPVAAGRFRGRIEHADRASAGSSGLPGTTSSRTRAGGGRGPGTRRTAAHG